MYKQRVSIKAQALVDFLTEMTDEKEKTSACVIKTSNNGRKTQ